jgi:hypothetical protein
LTLVQFAYPSPFLLLQESVSLPSLNNVEKSSGSPWSKLRTVLKTKTNIEGKRRKSKSNKDSSDAG